MQHITKHNIGEHTKRVVVLERFRVKGGKVLPGDFLTMSGHELYDALNRKLVKLAPEETEKPAVISSDSEKSKKKSKKKKS